MEVRVIPHWCTRKVDESFTDVEVNRVEGVIKSQVSFSLTC